MFYSNFSYCLKIAYFCAGIILAILTLFLLKSLTYMKRKVKDLTQENEKLLSLKASPKQENPLGHLFSEGTKTMTLGVQKDGKMTQISDSLLQLLGYTKKQLLGKNIYGTLMSLPSKKDPLESNIIHRIFQNPKLFTEHETEFLTKKGEKIWISWTNRLVEDKKGKANELLSVGFDITPRKKLEEELQFMAIKDSQTGILNRLALLENGTRELKRSIRYKHDFSVLALRLLSINKDLTSLQVENSLKQVVTFCHQTIRDVDYLGRVGEAEFVLLLPETPAKNVPFLQKRLEEKISEYNEKNSSLPIQISFGAASYTSKIHSIDELISKAILNIKQRKRK